MTTPPASPAAPASVICPKHPEGKGHHWILGSPHGAVVHGQCRYCDTEQDFDNSMEYRGPHDDTELAPTILERIQRRRGPRPKPIQTPGKFNYGQGPGPRPAPKTGQVITVPRLEDVSPETKQSMRQEAVNKTVKKIAPQVKATVATVATVATPLSGPVTTTASGNQGLGADPPKSGPLGRERAGAATPERRGSMGLKDRSETQIIGAVKLHGSISGAARTLGVTYSTLQDYLIRRGVDLQQFQPNKHKAASRSPMLPAASAGSADLRTVMQELMRLGQRIDRISERLATPHFHVEYIGGKLVFTCDTEEDCELVRNLLKEQHWVVKQG